MNQFTNEELKNIGVLISLAPIKGAEAVTVAQLLIKIEKMITPEAPVEEKKGDK